LPRIRQSMTRMFPICSFRARWTKIPTKICGKRTPKVFPKWTTSSLTASASPKTTLRSTKIQAGPSRWTRPSERARTPSSSRGSNLSWWSLSTWKMPLSTSLDSWTKGPTSSSSNKTKSTMTSFTTRCLSSVLRSKSTVSRLR